MRDLRPLVALLAAALLAALVAAGAIAPLPAPARLGAALLALVLAPGTGLVALGARPPGGRLAAAGWSFGLGVAWCAALALLSWAARVPVTVTARWMPWAGLAPWALAAARGALGAAGRSPRPAGLPWPAAAAVLLAAGIAAFHAGRLGTPMGYDTDSPDHVATLRRMLATGETFPRDALFRDAGRGGADVRKGLWHAVAASVAATARVSPFETWRGLGAWVVPFLLLNVAALGFLCRGPTGAALAAWALLLTYGGGLAHPALRQAAFATRIADQLALAAVTAVLADLAARRRGTRWAAVGLAFGAVAAHVFAAVHLGVTLGALGLALLLRDRGPGRDARRLAGTALAIAVACAPYLLARWLGTRGPVNPIHGEPQGLIRLFGPWQVVAFGQLWWWMGAAWVLVPLAWPWLAARARRDPAALLLLASTLAVALTAWNPLVVAALGGTGYLLMRMVWVVPLAALLAWLLPELAGALRTPGRTRRAAAAATLALAAVLLAPPALDGARLLADPAPVLAGEREQDPLRWRSAFAWMERGLPPATVVLSDPATSYLVPMMTGRPVVTVAGQHGPPGDMDALRRAADARDALDPWTPWERVREVVARRGVGAIALDGRFAGPARAAFGLPAEGVFARARARFDARPDTFPVLRDEGDFVVYGVRPGVLDTLTGPVPPRPWVTPWRPGPEARPAGADPDEPALAGFELGARSAAPGGRLRGVALWHAATAPRPGEWMAIVRFDREPALAGPAFAAKPVRKLVERLRGERLRFRDMHAPVGGRDPVERWGPGEVVRDSFELAVPADAAPGTYRVEARIRRDPAFENLRLGDWFFERDSWSGVPVGTMTVRPAAGATAAERGGRR